MTIKRYGTSCAERADGCFVKFEDYAALEAEVRAWRERFPGHVYRPQDECVANRMWLERRQPKRDCQKCGEKDLPSGVYCKGMGCPLNPAMEKA